MCLTLKLKCECIRSHTFWFVIVSEHMRHSKSWSIVLKITFSCVISSLTPLTSFNPVILKCLTHWRQCIMIRLNNCTEKMQIQLIRSISHLFTALHNIRCSLLITLRQGDSRSVYFLFNSDKILRDIQKLLTELTVLKADEVKVSSCSQNEVLQMSVTAETLTFNTAQIFFAECALLTDENQPLFKHNEVKVHQSTKSTVIEKVKVMSYKNIKNA